MKLIYLLLTLILFSYSNHAQTSTDSDEEQPLKWTPEKHMEFRSISGTTLTTDGEHVAYVIRTPEMEGEKSEYIRQIWVASTNGNMNVQYTRGENSSHSPAFSPDGKSIAFLSNRNEKTQLFIMRLMGGEAEQITTEKDGISSFKWSPGGSKIAFLKTDEKTEEEEKADKEKRSVIEVDKNFKFSHLYTIDVSSKDKTIQRLTNGDFHVRGFDWSPDSDKIVFSHQTNPKINTGFIDTDISWVASDSSAIHSLVSQPGRDDNPMFSPDGKRIAFTSNGGSRQPIGLSDTYVVALANKKIEALVQSPSRDCNLIGWSHDGISVYVAETHTTSDVALQLPADPNSDIAPKIMSDLSGTSGNFTFSKTGHMAYVYQTPDKPAELYVSHNQNQRMKQLSSVNTDVEMPELGKTELIKWTSKDGMEIEGILTYPVGYKKGNRVPLVLQIHGGPAGVFTKSFTGNPSIYMTQYFAQEGVAVLRPNPRGSTGYSKEFRYANFQDWGFGDYEDVMSGVEKVIEMGVADESRMTVMGWSYGGYLTSFLVTRTDRFKAASMGAGLPNLISMTSTTDIPDYLVGHMGGEFWNDYETYEKHSAMYRIKNVSIPTQVIHGANDLRVPFTQGQEFYSALKRRGIPTEMIVLPRTPHGPREPKLLMEVSPRILKWFNEFTTMKP